MNTMYRVDFAMNNKCRYTKTIEALDKAFDYEYIHADMGLPDISRLFETYLTKLFGLFSSKVIKIKKK